MVVAAACTSSGRDAGTTTTTTSPSQTSTTAVITTTLPQTTTAPPETTTTAPPTTTTTIPLDELQPAVSVVGDGFDNPVLLVADPDGGDDFVVEQPGRVVRLDADHTLVADLTDVVLFGGERGLLGLAFHPDFGSNRLAYVNYTERRTGETVIEQYRVEQGGMFDLSSRVEILRVHQPASNHNGGMIAFGPRGNLWIGMGDGGGRDDQFGNGQRADTLLGAMLRIRVGVGGGNVYEIPPDNPFFDGVEGRPEVWAIGVRNPWRFALDGDDVWIADVGQRRIEEVNVASATEPGLNFGWSIIEGSECFRTTTCDASELVLPIVEYPHSEGCSVTGGVVYRGSAIPELAGHFLYSDYCSGFLRSVSRDGDAHDWTDSTGALGNVAGFGVGGDGEVYILTLSGTVMKLERSGP